MSYNEPDDEPEVEVEEEYDDDEDEMLLIDIPPWQAPFAWEIVTQKVEVPNAVHEAASKWWISKFENIE